ncbi:DUF1367 family protein [Enterobacter cloacae]|uniref:DUF1367 family protein n=1 Tax=Enterobacter cloacae TaxID=550 RepID=A0A3R9AQW3_ENTCL|nr:DUF1367 family protein [Enterobacter cloacae]
MYQNSRVSYCDVKQARNYLFHKRFFALRNLGFEYWTPTGGSITPAENSIFTGTFVT